MRFHIPRLARRPLLTDELGSVWRDIEWLELAPHHSEGHSGYATRVKMGYFPEGIAFLLECEDARLTCQSRQDFDDLYLDDVFEIFLWPDQRCPLYFEYEISPLGRELALLVPNYGGQFMGWRPWHYEGARASQKRVIVEGGDAIAGASVRSWKGEVVIPFELLRGVISNFPQAGTVWRGNCFRMDYDRGVCDKWCLSKVTDGQFHNYEEFPEFIFG